MNDLKTVRDMLVEAGDLMSDYHLQIAISILSRMIETPAPKGWKLVPIEPTIDMCFLGGDILSAISENQTTGFCAEKIYKAMLSAAPTPAPTEKVDLDALKREFCNWKYDLDNAGETVYPEDMIDYLANTGRLR